MDAKARRQVELGVEDLLKHDRANPGSWQALWFAGKGLPSLGDQEGVARTFGQAFALKRDKPDIAREYGLTLMSQRRFEEAEAVDRAACEANPHDAGLVANLALTLLFLGRTEEAEETASRALDMDTGDTVTKAVLSVIRDVRAGRRAPPQSIEELGQKR